MDENDGDESDRFPRAGLRNLQPVRGSTAQSYSSILRTVVLFFVLLDGFEEWFKIPAGSLSFIRHVISCILFSLEQSRGR